MNEGSPRGHALLWAWAIGATMVGVAATGLAVYLFLVHRSSPVPAETVAGASRSPFLDLREETLPGVYKWIENGKESPITLFDDHSFSGAFGRRPPDHRWVITRDSLWIIWANKTDKFNAIESPGVYLGVRDDATPVRMEKEP